MSFFGLFKHFVRRRQRNQSALHLQVTIKAPNSEDSSYVNKKGFHSVGCQLVCNARGLLLSAETHWPGGLKDTDVLERSALHKQLQDTEEGWLLGEISASSRVVLQKLHNAHQALISVS